MRHIILAILCILTALPTASYARDQIRIVGSSTVYPFVTVVAETFGGKTDFATPIIEQTGTGGGFQYFCSGVGENTADMANASRAIKDSETTLCKQNGVEAITEIKIGYDGIVLANVAGTDHFSLSKKDIFLALAKEVPQDGKLVANPYKTWNEVNASLPDKPIVVLGPPPTSGTRDAFVELVLEPACKDIEAFKTAYPDAEERKKHCHLIREDKAFVEAGENDNLIVQKLVHNNNALGVFGFSFLDQNASLIQGSHVDGVQPTYESIADGSYSVSRPLFVYVKNAHADTIPGMREFLQELTSEDAMGEEGYLALKGLIPISEEERTKLLETVNSL